MGTNDSKTAYLGETLISWLLTLIALPLCALVLHHVRDTNYEGEEVAHIEDMSDKATEGVSAPVDHQRKTSAA